MKKSKKKLRPLGDITTDMEPLYFEMLLDHELQRHEVIGMFLAWADAHTLGLETYEDGSHPVFYGPGEKRETDDSVLISKRELYNAVYQAVPSKQLDGVYNSLCKNLGLKTKEEILNYNKSGAW